VSKAAPFFREARATLVLAVPMMAGQLSQMLMGLIDAAMVGRVGIVSLAAAAFANSLLAVPLLISIGLLTAVSVQISQAHGAGRREELAKCSGTASCSVLPPVYRWRRWSG